ncbi:hypothetical protein, partial [Staphylococcus epidermidis]|uniref:hypothetical protein n=1 Tax=Staphylococcus epidermidis TaxID=1282 RepID=UPI001C930044
VECNVGGGMVCYGERFKEAGEWKNEDLGRGGGNNCVEVSVKGGNRSGMKDRVKGVEKMMSDIKGIRNVKCDL